MYRKDTFGKSNSIKFKGADILIDKSYFSNATSKNILKDDVEKNVSDNLSNVYVSTSLENMVLNSNLDNENVIK